ncbi:FkbM family methyltransferase [Massilia suwonensis]|uniref:FkbM family methyltransferase n=1 Tax=Massilia suwonensis TaxID=648895 RepID=A0ABW0MPF5_9BURK
MNNLPKRRTAFVLASTDHGSMLVNRHDYRMVGSTGYGVGYQLLEKSSFDADEVSFVLQLLESRRRHAGDGLIALDCGANIGVHTIEWARFMHGWGDVLAFEAQERIFYALAGNLTLNNCFNARAIWAAIGAGNGALRVPVPDYLVPSSFGSLELRKNPDTEFIGQDVDYSDAAAQTVQMLSIDAMNLPRLDLIKLDIEGMELEALQGARASIERLKPYLVIEKIKSNEAELMRFVTELGYVVFPLGINLLAVHAADPIAAEIRQIANP